MVNLLPVPEWVKKAHPLKDGQELACLETSFRGFNKEVLASLVSEGLGMSVKALDFYWIKPPKRVDQTWPDRNDRQIGTAVVIYKKL